MIGKIIRYFASILPISIKLRGKLYKISGMKIGKDVVIDRGVQVTKSENIEIGDRVCICANVSILGEVTAYPSMLEEKYDIYKSAKVIIKDDAYLGVKATILPGVTIGKMATVGANSLVIEDVPDYTVCLGVPARIILKRQIK